jgi:PhzF family phenazine biosynthesis protein
MSPVRYMSPVLYVVDAFTNQPFLGNPAAVCLSENPCDETWMRNVAREMNLAETAFAHPIDGGYSLRWLTPKVEVDLCGHATLATAHVLWQTGKLRSDEAARFHTRSGWLICRQNHGWIEMDFPALATEFCEAPNGLATAIHAEPQSFHRTSMDYLVEIASAGQLRELVIDMNAVALFPVRGLIVTAKSDVPEYDFISRFFAPACGVNEDPVTGSAHCALGPYWSKKLGKTSLVAYQASERGGIVRMKTLEDRVLLEGQAVLMSKVEFVS